MPFREESVELVDSFFSLLGLEGSFDSEGFSLQYQLLLDGLDDT